ncbi:MAG: hypothetical protein R6X06_07365 [Gammaproteobacteria bacterium]
MIKPDPNASAGPAINIAVALACEARPLIEHFGLKRQTQAAYPVYQGGHIQLIVAGVGQLNAATAVGYLAGLTQHPAAWLNIGIAGHKTHAIGALYLAHKITRQQDSHSWYPAFTFKPGIATASLTSFSQPVTDYEDDVLHDMEAAGFYPAASRFSSVEFVHCLKVVSDNAEHPDHKLDKHWVSQQIAAQLKPLSGFITKLHTDLARWHEITAVPSLYDELLQHWHFSTYQQHQLQQLLKRWSTCHADEEWCAADMAKLKNSREILRYLERTLDIETGV